MKKWKKVVLVIAAVIVIPGFVVSWIISPKFILNPYRFDIRQHMMEFPNGTTPEEFGLMKEDFDQHTADGVDLDGWLIHAKDPAKATIIMLHGIGGCKEMFLPTAKKFAARGYNVLLFDLRAHGQSTGENCTYGWLEKNDMSAYVKMLRHRDGLPVGVYGASLGGAIAYQAMAIDPAISFGVIECTFDELQHVVRAYTARYVGFTFNPLADFALWRAEMVADFESDDVRPCEAAATIHAPVFVAHGNCDIHIPISFGRRNFEAIASSQKEFHEIDGADHNGIHKHGGTTYFEDMISFLDKAVARSQSYTE